VAAALQAAQLVIIPPPLGYGVLSDDARLTCVCLTSDVCVSRIWGLSRE